MVAARNRQTFTSLRHLVLCVPELNKKEMVPHLRNSAPLMPCRNTQRTGRRGALWQESAAVGRYRTTTGSCRPRETAASRYSFDSRAAYLVGFQHGRLTIGKHPMSFHRERMRA
jgi:hypothetical protein